MLYGDKLDTVTIIFTSLWVSLILNFSSYTTHYTLTSCLSTISTLVPSTGVLILAFYVTLCVYRLWNSLTESFGKVLAVDWSQTRTRELYLPTLNLNLDAAKEAGENSVFTEMGGSPLKGADEVIREIDLIMQVCLSFYPAL